MGFFIALFWAALGIGGVATVIVLWKGRLRPWFLIFQAVCILPFAYLSLIPPTTEGGMLLAALATPVVLLIWLCVSVMTAVWVVDRELFK